MRTNDEALEYVREGDTLVVWRLDRFGRSLKHLIETITNLNNRKIGFKSITENIDTTTSGGKLIFHIFGALSESELMQVFRQLRHGEDSVADRKQKHLTPQKSINGTVVI